MSKIFPNSYFGYRKITVERPLQLNFQANAERIARLDEQKAFANLANSEKAKDEAGRLRDIEEGKQRQADIKAMLFSLCHSGLDPESLS